MGKKRTKERRPYSGEVSTVNVERKGPQQPKTYSYGKEAKKVKATERGDDQFKVHIPADKEECILNLIQESKRKQELSGSVSKRLTSKKLSDLYNTLQNAGFKHSQIEQAMSSTIACGGDLIDTLDWLCLFTPNDQLPEGFSQTLEQEERKIRPKFDTSRDVTQHPVAGPSQAPCDDKLAESSKEDKKETKESMKDWILRYSQVSSGEEETSDGDTESDPNEDYLELVAKLEDLKVQASDAKSRGDKETNNKMSQQIRSLLHDINEIEKHPRFDSRMKLSEPTQSQAQQEERQDSRTGDEGSEGRVHGDVKESEEGVHSDAKESEDAHGGVKDSQEDARSDVNSDVKYSEESTCGLEGFAMFEEIAAQEEPKDKKLPLGTLDKRCFEYTRKQWTGKSPKQFLIDWVRKNLPKSPPPSYQKVAVRGNLWKSKCKVQRQKEDDLIVTPDIVCDNVKEAEHLASTLALYQLCKGQSVYQLLPPPYRDVWLEWKDNEAKIKDQRKEKENKPRDQFVAKLLKKLKCSEVEEPEESGQTTSERQSRDVEESWEDMLDDEEEVQPARPELDRNRKPERRTSKPKKIYSDEALKHILLSNQKREIYKQLLETRKQLPVFQHRDEVMSAFGRENVVVIAGETGSGKSTQVPQFILQEMIESGNGSKTNIVCTEPRRISTISLANRVSEELGEDGPGSVGSLCGYQIRFESRRADSTRLTYVTTGVMLRRLQQDPRIADISCVIVDEVHERSVQSDFLLIILRDLLYKRKDFKVILMSATVDAEKFSTYFQHCPVVHIPGRTFPVQVYHLEDAVEQSEYKLEEDSPYSLRYEHIVNEESAQVAVSTKGGGSHDVELTWTKDDLHLIDTSGLSASEYKLRTRNIVSRLNPDRINMDLIVELLTLFDTSPEYQAMQGSVLVFMPGFSHIQELHDLLLTEKRFANKQRYRLVPLHSVLSSKDQSLAFTLPPKGMRKIVIATNIAETGITIPDVVFVIDSGKVKENRYIETSQMSSLEEVWISKASAKQRQGRAGRVREGVCFRLYPKTKYESLRAYSVPEILRVPLEELCLHIMKCDLGDPTEMLSKAVDAPQLASISRAMAVLREVGACNPSETSLTPLGHHLAVLPVNVRVGKMLVYGAMLGCLYPVCVIGAAMTDKSPFLSPLGKQDQADLAKQALALENSDHLTLLRAFLGWKDAQSKGFEAELQYCNKFFLKRTSLVDIEKVCNDLQKLVHSIGFDSVDAVSILKKSKTTKKLVSSAGVLNISQSDGLNSLSADLLSPAVSAILKAVLTAGLYPNVAKTSYQAPVDAAANPKQEVCFAQTPQGQVSAHPSSVNRFLGANGFLVYHEKVKSSRVYIRGSTLVRAYPLLLFGGDICVQHKQKSVTVDDWIEFQAFAKTGVIFKELRLLLENLLERKLYDPSLNLKDEPLIPLLLELLATER